MARVNLFRGAVDDDRYCERCGRIARARLIKRVKDDRADESGEKMAVCVNCAAYLDERALAARKRIA